MTSNVKELQQEKMMVKEQKRYDQVMRQEAKKQKFLNLRYNKMKNVQVTTCTRRRHDC